MVECFFQLTRRVRLLLRLRLLVPSRPLEIRLAATFPLVEALSELKLLRGFVVLQHYEPHSLTECNTEKNASPIIFGPLDYYDQFKNSVLHPCFERAANVFDSIRFGISDGGDCRRVTRNRKKLHRRLVAYFLIHRSAFQFGGDPNEFEQLVRGSLRLSAD